MNRGVPLTIAVCCLYPLLIHLALTYGVKFFTARDWKSLRWDEIKFPWSKS